MLNEQKSKTVVLSFGRLNPITSGHEKLVNKIKSVAKTEAATPQLYLSHSQDKAKNPLSYSDKYTYARQAFGTLVQKSNAKTIIQVLQELDGQFTDVIVVVGSDRIREFDKLLNKYNGKDYTYDSIKVVSAGERDPDADDVTGMSASKMRALAAEGDLSSFTKGLPRNLKRGKTPQEIFDKIRDAMGITEEMTVEESLELFEVLNFQQGRRRKILMQQIKNKIIEDTIPAVERKRSFIRNFAKHLSSRLYKENRERIRSRKSSNEQFNFVSELSAIIESVEKFKLSENIQSNLRKKSERYNIPVEELKQAYLKCKSPYSEQVTFQSLNSLLANRARSIFEAIEYHTENEIPFYENVFRMYSDNYFQLFREARILYSKGVLKLDAVDEELINTDIGDFGIYEENGRSERVPLDCPMVTEDEDENVELNKPKRGGPKKFYVYVKDPQTGNIKKVSFGDTTGLKVKLDDKEAAASFAARHQCSTKKDKTKPGYWACRLPKFARQLGLSGGGNHFW